MTKQDIVTQVSKETGFAATQVMTVLQHAFDSISNALAEAQHIEIRDFGVFDARLQKPRVGRNPNNGASVPIPARAVVRFKAGKEMRRLVVERATSKLMVLPVPAARAARTVFPRPTA